MNKNLEALLRAGVETSKKASPILRNLQIGFFVGGIICGLLLDSKKGSKRKINSNSNNRIFIK